MNKYICPVCGYPNLDEPPRDENGRPSFDICDCCGIEFGYEDCTETNIIEFREKWIKSGAKWFCENEKPSNWDIKEQLRNINIEIR